MMKVKRNQPCPCGSGKKFKKCCLSSEAPLAVSWQDEKRIHLVSKGEPHSQEELDLMTKKYQEKIRQSPIWDKMVKEFGQEKAEELLKQCKAELG
ncbi:MAG: hypothetical protein D3925_11900 [Candidatus Electrothrix sp. AR5]|nr:hypothetical protein [Candidatus Electrothrix sp. AR5]